MPGQTRGVVASLRCILQGENFLLSKCGKLLFRASGKVEVVPPERLGDAQGWK